MADPAHPSFAERSAWARSLSAPVRTFVQAQASSAIFLLAGALAALVWANVVAVQLRVVLDDATSISAWATGRCPRTCGTGSTTA